MQLALISTGWESISGQTFMPWTRNARRRIMLQELVDWRNAIAHQDFDPVSARGYSDTSLVESERVAECDEYAGSQF